MNRQTKFNIALIAAYVLAYLISKYLNFSYLEIIPGLFLIYYLPGRNLNSIILKKRRDDWFVRLPLDILSSISVLSILYLILKSQIEFQDLRLTLLVFVTNLVLATASFFATRYQKKQPDLSIAKFINKNKTMLIIMAIPVLIFIITLIMNPYIYDIDSLIYYDTYEVIRASGMDFKKIFYGREAFGFLMMSSDYIASIGYVGFYKFFTPLIFFATSPILFSISNNKKTITNWSYLLILASPMAVIMDLCVRPETMTIAFTVPILVLIYLAIKNNDKLLAILSLFYAFATFRFHETGFILLITVLVGLLILLIQNRKEVIQYLRLKLWYAITVASALALLIFYKYSALSVFLHKGMALWMITLIGQGFAHLKWEWWFIDDVVTQMGARISWPGITALYYYLYDGIILFLFGLILVIFLVILQRKQKVKFGARWLALTPAIFYFGVNFAYAEILPRMGIILLPNRAWPHIMLAIVVISIVLLERIFTLSKSKKQVKIIFYLLIISVFSGIVGTILGSGFMGAMVLPQEHKAIETIAALPKDAVVVSTQRNNNLVKIYGKKDFVQIKKSGFNNDTFADVVKEGIDEYAEQTNNGIFSNLYIGRRVNGALVFNGKTLLETEQYTPIYDKVERMDYLKEFDKASYKEVYRQVVRANTLFEKEQYFLYSFAKLDRGIMKTREWWRISSDIEDYQFFKNYSGETVYKDGDFILIRLK